MADPIEITVVGADKLAAALDKFGDEIKRGMKDAGDEAAKGILETVGLRKYPPLTSANMPPTPYYIRRRGMQYATHNNQKSENYGRSYYVKHKAGSTVIGNSASYAKYLAGDKDQTGKMASIGWRKLVDVAREKIGEITKIYQGWVDRLIKTLGL